MPVRLGDLAVVFISYDEPQADAHWGDLLTKYPRAERVHGVRGISGAYRRAAAVAATERFVTVDGDRVVDAALNGYKGCDWLGTAETGWNGLACSKSDGSWPGSRRLR